MSDDAAAAAERWARICTIFELAADLPEADWEELIERESGGDTTLRDEVVGILSAERQDRFRLDRPRLFIDHADSIQEDEVRVGQIVARYRLVRLIGSGGMGTVYEGVRADEAYEQRVAVKLIRPQLVADGVTARFRRERQILAALEHRNIARLLDGGRTDHGEPFFVMEYVAGMPITRYCDEHRLTINARLRLFMQACAAVQHAHGKLIVHRDLKPANILVAADGSVKLLDFGIATLLGAPDNGDAADDGDDHSALQRTPRALTPEYASPEQLRGEPVSAASDVYSLGVILYELLAGSRPFVLAGRSPLTALRAVETTLPQPSASATAEAAWRASEPTAARLRRRLSGELDNIVRKAIRVAPDARYLSVEQLANDLRRYLDGMPVLALPASVTYRARKFVRRHKVSVAAAAVALLALTGGIIATVVQARRANMQASRAEVARAQVARINTFLQDMLSAPDTRWVASGTQHASQATVLEVLDDASRRAGTDLDGEPRVESGVRRTLGRTYTAIGRYDNAITQLARALAIDRRVGAATIPIVITDMHDLGMAEFRFGNNHAADTLFRSVLRTCRTSDQTADTAHVCGQSVNDLGLALLLEDRLPDAEKQFRESLVLAQQVFGPVHPSVAVVLGNIALVRDRMGDIAGAERLYRQSLAVWGKVKDEHPEELLVLDDLGSLLYTEGRLAAAESLVTRAIEIGTHTEGAEHPDVGYSWVEAGAIHRLARRLALADSETRKGMRILADAGSSGRYFFVQSWTDRGELLTAEGNSRDAVPVLRTALDTASARYAAGDPRLAEVKLALGEALVASNDNRAGVPLLSAGYGALLHRYGPNHPETIRAMRQLASARD